MRRAVTLASVLATLVLGTVANPSPSPVASGLDVHEWGTFTSIAGEDDRPVEWLPLAGASDLPSFVHLLRVHLKPSLPGAVRMETPVIYFYAPGEMTVDVRVRFRQGVITEWFPRAAVSPSLVRSGALARPDFEGTIVWTDVGVMPRGSNDFPVEGRPSHYYAARETDASPIARGPEREKFLFYRGVGAFAPPVAANVLPDHSISVTSRHGESLGSIILFDHRAGRIRYEVRHVAGTESRFAVDLPDGDADALFAELHSVLIANGLYPREATAMLATWKDSWFEEGTRLFYIVPRRTIDAILPLDIDPTPAALARVFVGRVELFTSDTLAAVRAALARRDDAALQTYGRFLHPILTRLQQESRGTVIVSEPIPVLSR